MKEIKLIGWKEHIKNYMIKVGQIGNGKFGEKILSKLNMMDDVEIIWVCNSTDKWWTKTIDLDWVIIATPNELHYEQAKHFLKRGINVFCEKPGTLSGISLHDLIATAKIHKAKFYVDDVLSHQNTDPNLRNFTYKK